MWCHVVYILIPCFLSGHALAIAAYEMAQAGSPGLSIQRKVNHQKTSRCYVPHSRPIEHASAKRRRNSSESVLLHVRQEKIVLIGKPFVIAAYFLYDAVRAHAKRALRVVITQTSKRRAYESKS
jgi:hypothetical protein